MVERVPVELVTIVVEAVLEDRVLHDLERLGASGWTVTEARGRGKGVRATWEGENVRIEALVARTTADAILEHLEREYFPHYAVAVYVSPVEVLRREKFT